MEDFRHEVFSSSHWRFTAHLDLANHFLISAPAIVCEFWFGFPTAAYHQLKRSLNTRRYLHLSEKRVRFSSVETCKRLSLGYQVVRVWPCLRRHTMPLQAEIQPTTNSVHQLLCRANRRSPSSIGTVFRNQNALHCEIYVVQEKCVENGSMRHFIAALLLHNSKIMFSHRSQSVFSILPKTTQDVHSSFEVLIMFRLLG